MQKQIIVVTGGAGGIGTACARAFKDDDLVITDYSQEAVDKTLADLQKEGYSVTGIACDITDRRDLEKLKEFVASQGTFKALIHTAGVSGTVKDLKMLFDINLVATQMLLDTFYDLAVKDSVVVLLSSMMGHDVPEHKKCDAALRNPQESNSFEIVKKFVKGDSNLLYDYTKRGVMLITKESANKWGEKGARIVSVSPGVIETPMALKAAEEHPEKMEHIKSLTPLKRNGSPEDIAEVVAFLASDKASFITGTDILVDGGVFENIKSI